MLKKFFHIIIFLFLIIISLDGMGQCVTCKSALESDLNNSENSIARGINDGILYLMAIPYILLIATVFIVYNLRKRNNKEAKF